MTTPGGVPDDVVPQLRRLEEARRDLAEREAVQARLATSRASLDRARSEHQRLLDALTTEQRDVERLEHAEAGYEAAREAVAASGGDVDDADAAAAVEELSRRRELREVEQARAAGWSALQGLVAARQKLDSADSWSAWDTFGGGGMVSSALKHERLDETRQLLRRAGDLLVHFSRELDDVGVAGVELPEFDGLTRGLDIWFDNVFTDLAVRDRIKRAQRELATALAQVERVVADLDARALELRA
ncbi:hypothetical protein [Terrabacter aeriphilus]|uniref:hypothetical protein n=1 Tax=Terrabacter aeriphilus TaxID=515662 RepID=UPI0031F07D7C